MAPAASAADGVGTVTMLSGPVNVSTPLSTGPRGVITGGATEAATAICPAPFAVRVSGTAPAPAADGSVTERISDICI